jgi:A/G-specific adenine glycosylase
VTSGQRRAPAPAADQPVNEADDFAGRLLTWWDAEGRHDLPWQRDRDPYRIWISEIMLQQTQVATVIPYFERFMARFPDVRALADASEDEVLHYWSGLGYYARARNLHRAARAIRDEHGGVFPRFLETVHALPGVGRSTAGAILAQAYGDRHAILDGNVKRVLARYHAVEGWPGRSAVLNALWDLAERHTPGERVADYTQAVMDLGATVCRARAPACEDCPVADGCAARQQGRTADFPGRKPRKLRPKRQTTMLLVEDVQGRVLLRRRPSRGLWGGLWSLPELGDPSEAAGWCATHFGQLPRQMLALPPVRHGFTHFELEITPVVAEMDATGLIMEGAAWLWYNGDAAARVGLAAVVDRLLADRRRDIMGEIE